jgi:DNA recombination protein RmuC
LESHSENFLKLASERLDKKNIEAQSTFQQKVVEFQALLSPVKDTLSKIQTDLSKVEKERIEQFSRITEQLFQVTQTSEKLKDETSQLAKALRRPEVRGSWGEIQLRRVVELAGMNAYSDFEEQVSVHAQDEQQNLRLQKPDLVVKLPNQRTVIVDAKAVLDAFLDAVEAATPELKQKALERHAKNLRSRVTDLSRKSYWEQFDHSPEFAVLFIPNEALLSAAVEIDKTIIEDALKEKIIIATPTTLVALLKAIAFGWQQNQLAEGAQQMIDKVSEFYERLTPWLKHLGKLGDALNAAVKSYNESVSSLDSRVLPAAKKIHELGFKDKPVLLETPEIETNAKKSLKNSPTGGLTE